MALGAAPVKGRETLDTMRPPPRQGASPAAVASAASAATSAIVTMASREGWVQDSRQLVAPAKFEESHSAALLRLQRRYSQCNRINKSSLR